MSLFLISQDMSAAKLAHLQDERVIQAQSEKDNDFTVREHRNLTHNVEEFKERNRRLLVLNKSDIVYPQPLKQSSESAHHFISASS